MKKFSFTILITLTIFNLVGQNPIKTVKDDGNYLGKRFETSLDNFINILELDLDEFTKYSKELGFDTKPAANFCVESFPQAKTSMSILTRCSGRIFYAYSNSKQNTSTLSEMYNKLNKEVSPYLEDDFNIFLIEYGGKKYKVKLKSKEEYGELREIVIIEKK
jgi:hypothetical protein